MLIPKIRFLLAVLFLIIGIVLHVKVGFSSAWYLYLAALILLMTHFKFGNVSAAFLQLQKGKPQQAAILINQIKKPEWLTKSHQAYYYFTKGMIAMQDEELLIAESDLKMALDKGLRNDNDKALVSLNLAHLFFVQKKHPEASQFVEKAKTYTTNDLMIQDKIKELEGLLGMSQ